MDVTKNAPIIEVDSRNFLIIWPKLKQSMLESAFIAIDAEMSGLGSADTFQRNAEDRYCTMRCAARSRSLISLGMTCFALVDQHSSTDEETPNRAVYKTVSFNILMLCVDSFMIDPSAASFLTAHGFDFNKLFSHGLKYKKGNHDTKNGSAEGYARRIFEELIRVRKPIVVHNGFCDLIYMYECLYATCPSKLSVFMADVSEMFPSGIYDTKVLAQFHEKLDSSFLEYVVTRFHTDNAKAAQKSKPNIAIELSSGTLEDLLGPYKNLNSMNSKPLKDICTRYRMFGYCNAVKKGNCKLSHNIFDVIKFEESKRRKRKSDDVCSGGAPKKSKNDVDGCDFIMPSHRAGIDSFFTGFSFAVFTVLHANELKPYVHPSSVKTFSSEIPNLPDSMKSDIVNRLYLNAQHPLRVTKSHFSKPSSAHEQNIIRIFVGSS